MYRFWKLKEAVAITWPKLLMGKNEKIETQNEITKPKEGKKLRKFIKMIITISLLTKPLNFPSLWTGKNQYHADEAHGAMCKLRQTPARMVREEDMWSDIQPRSVCKPAAASHRKPLLPHVHFIFYPFERGHGPNHSLPLKWHQSYFCHLLCSITKCFL